jgi:hypothetical protein
MQAVVVVALTASAVRAVRVAVAMVVVARALAQLAQLIPAAVVVVTDLHHSMAMLAARVL